MTDFWILRKPDTIDAERRLADWPSDEPLEFERVSCSVCPDGHRGVRKRITTPLCAVLPNREPLDFVWTHLSECLVQRHVLDIFTDMKFTGFEALAAKVRFARRRESPPSFWELVVSASAGVAAAESGYSVIKTCPGCGLTYNTRVEDPTKVVDVAKWDGNDFFQVSPVTGWIFVTDRVVKTLRRFPLRGWKAYSLGDMKESFDIAVPEHLPPSEF